MLAIEIELATMKDQCHRVFVFVGGAIRREVELRGTGSKASAWKWTAEGPPEPWEDVAAYETEDKQDRLTRPRLYSCAAAWGIDPERHLFQRDLEASVLIT